MNRALAFLVALTLLVLAPTANGRVDRIAKFECLGAPATIVGTPGNDNIHGTNFADVISAQGGADLVHGLGGNDRLCGDAGNDTIFDGFGADRIDGGLGIDTLYLCPDGTGDTYVNVERVIQSSLGCQ